MSQLSSSSSLSPSVPNHHHQEEQIKQEQKRSWNPRITQTPFSATTVAFSPHVPNLLAVGTGQNFGIAGRGCQHIFVVSSDASVLRVSSLCQQTILCCRWSEESPFVLGAALGDGTVIFWDIRRGTTTDASSSELGLSSDPLLVLKGHERECFSLEWNIQQSNLLLTSSWDGSVRLWDVPEQRELLVLRRVHGDHPVYKASWSPSQPSIFATCGSDGYMRIFDVRENPSRIPNGCTSFAAQSVLTQQCHTPEALSVDWNKFSPFHLATSGTDQTIRVWDIRKHHQADNKGTSGLNDSCVVALLGHSLAARCVQWSPFKKAILASGSYDMSVGIWDIMKGTAMQHRYCHHSEFVVDVSWSLFTEGVLSSVSWDRSVAVWDAVSGRGPSRLNSRHSGTILNASRS